MLSDVTDDEQYVAESMSHKSYGDVPHLEGGEQLSPFARIETFRTSWKAATTSEFSGLKVDIDVADSGYMVGEVEALCDRELSHGDVGKAKEKIRTFVKLVTQESGNDADATINGKLEFILMKDSPDLYDACVRAGVINAMK